MVFNTNLDGDKIHDLYISAGAGLYREVHVADIDRFDSILLYTPVTI